MSKSYIWLHEDALNLQHPVVQSAGPEARVIFIWDSAYFQRQAYSLKRLTFIYECLTGMELNVYAGDTETVLRDICAGSTLYVPDTPNPEFLKITETLKQEFPVKIIKDTPFIDTPDDVDMTRFFRFWNKSRKSALGINIPS